MKIKKMLILGANNPEVVRLFESFNEVHREWKLIGFLDNDPAKADKDFMGYKVIGGSDKITEEQFKDCYVINAITRDAITRRTSTNQLLNYGAKFTNLIHPDVYLKYVQIGKGLYIQDGVILQSSVVVCDHVSIHMGSLIGHESSIGEFSFIAHGCNISGLVKIEDSVFIGAGSTILPRLRIGNNSIIGAGAVVISDVEPHSVVVGNPAKLLRKIDQEV